MFKILSPVLVLGLFALGACKGGTPATGEAPHEDGPCTVNSDCGPEFSCLAYGDGLGACAANCTVSVDDCGLEASCGEVGSLSVGVCQDPDEAIPEGEVPGEEERPYIPCETDAECSEYGSDAICSEWMGFKECTSRCDVESDCSLPSLGGIEIDFMTCLPDESDTNRSACVPDVACFANPLDCISGIPGL